MVLDDPIMANGRRYSTRAQPGTGNLTGSGFKAILNQGNAEQVQGSANRPLAVPLQ